MQTHSWTTLVVPALAAAATLVIASPARADEKHAAPMVETVRDPGWPRTSTTADGCRVQMFQPQVASWDDQKRLIAYAAVVHVGAANAKPSLGTITVEADTTVALAERLVSFTTLTVTEANFGAREREHTRHILTDIKQALSAAERVIGLDYLLAGLDRSAIRPKNVEGVIADAPKIFFSTKPALLVSFDGDPIWSPIQDSDLKYAVNTNWDLFAHGPSQQFFLRHDAAWLKAGSPAGPWLPAGTLPDSLMRLPSDQNWKDVKASLPGRRMTAAETPTVFTSTTPAELILLRGAPSYVLVRSSGDLLWVNNTDSDVFRLGRTGTIYYLVAGRWFSAPDFTGPWTFATPALPDEFRQIPIEHPRSRVLASVPGTPQAAEAVLLAQLPQTARVHKNEVKAPDVRYAGEPRFEPIATTSLVRAVNTDKDVIRAGALYYLCFQGVWFVSSTPDGPWQVAATVPASVYTIPASSASHHLTYVTIVEDDSDWVTFQTTAGYSGVTVAWGCAVWGTGYSYTPYVYYGGYYPIYYPYYATYGASAWYNPWSGTYQRGAIAYGPYGGAGAGALYNPTTGTYARGAMAWGPYGAEGAAQAYNPRTGTYAQTRQGSGVYGSWGSSYVQRGDDWARTARATNNVTGATAHVTRTDEGAMVSGHGPAGSGFVAAGEEGVYAGRDGSVYRRGDTGGWQKYENGAWTDAARPADGAATARDRAAANGADGSRLGQLERDRTARIEGAQRAREQGGLRNAPRGQAGSYRPSGARRPSGGRRR